MLFSNLSSCMRLIWLIPLESAFIYSFKFRHVPNPCDGNTSGKRHLRKSCICSFYVHATLHSTFPVLSCLDCFQDLPRLLRILQNSKRSVSRHWRERRLSHDSGDAANLARKWNWISPVTLDEGTSTCNSSEPLASLSLTGLRTSRLAKNIDLTWATLAGYKFSDDVSG